MAVTDTENYLNFYGLKKDPFAMSGVYSPAGRRHELLEQLIHLNQFSHLVLGVLAPDGYGKSTMFNMLSKQLEQQSDIVVVEFEGHQGLKTDDLLRQLALQWHIDGIAMERQELLRQLRSHNLSRSSVGIRHCILIDDAHLLDHEVLENLQQLTSGLPEEQAIGLTLFCREGSIDLRSIFRPSDTLHLLHMTALSNKDAFNFLQDYFLAAGHKQGVPISPDVIEKIYLAAEGIPVRLKNLTREYMSDQAATAAPKEKKAIPVSHIIALIGLLMVLSTTLAFQFLNLDDRFNLPVETDNSQMFEPQAVENPIAERLKEAASQVEARQQDNLAEPAQTELEKGEIEILVAARPVTDPVQEQASASLAESVASARLAEEARTAANDQLSEPEPVPEPVPESTTSAPEPDELESPAEKTTVSSSEQISPVSDWLADKPGDYYTIQLLGARTQDAVEQFIADQQNPDAFHFVKTQFQNKDWFIVVYGNYADRSLAERSLRALPADLRRQEPWLRTFANIRSSR